MKAKSIGCTAMETGKTVQLNCYFRVLFALLRRSVKDRLPLFICFDGNSNCDFAYVVETRNLHTFGALELDVLNMHVPSRNSVCFKCLCKSG